MRKLLVLAMAVCVMFATLAIAQDASQSGGTSAAATPPLKTLKGTIKTEGDKTVFVSDKDQKSWEIVNPDAVKGHEGHHVEVSAHVYADKGQIHVMSVKMMKQKSSM
jgi:DNA-directed RNA polymerase alpha subunit